MEENKNQELNENISNTTDNTTDNTSVYMDIQTLTENQPPKVAPPKKPKISPEERRKKRIKRKIKLYSLITALILVVVGIIWGIVALVTSDSDDDNSNTESYISDETEAFTEKSLEDELSAEASEEGSEESEISQESSEISTENTSEEISQEEPEELPWYLTLVNGKNPLPIGFECPLTEMENELMSDGRPAMVDERIVEYLQAMLSDARKEGLIPIITSSYRTYDDQQRIMDDYIATYGEEEAKKWVAVPGTSEHQVGLAVDISSGDYDNQDPYYIWSWLEEHSWKYGFILRYTSENQSITGVNPEPWHFRYVGIEDAEKITSQGLTLEEYVEKKAINCLFSFCLHKM